MYEHILVAVSFEEEHDPTSSIQAAKALADKGARVTLLHVTEHVPSYAIKYMSQEYARDLQMAVHAELSDLAAQFKNGKGVVVDGHSSRTILEWAEENEVDCIVLDSHRPGLEDYFLGSTASRVVRHAHCAVHVVR